MCTLVFACADPGPRGFYPLSLHDALPISGRTRVLSLKNVEAGYGSLRVLHKLSLDVLSGQVVALLGGNRSEEHTSELQSHVNLVCRLLLEKKTRAPR